MRNWKQGNVETWNNPWWKRRNDLQCTQFKLMSFYIRVAIYIVVHWRAERQLWTTIGRDSGSHGGKQRWACYSAFIGASIVIIEHKSIP